MHRPMILMNLRTMHVLILKSRLMSSQYSEADILLPAN